MAKIVFAVVALCFLSVATAHFGSKSYLLQGCVYCDTCRCGFETPATKYLHGAEVRVECRNRATSELTFTKKAVTDSAGKYKILIDTDHHDEYCDAVLVKSSDPQCSKPDAGRDRARVILTDNNGMNSRIRFANALGFLKETPLASCPEILQQYQESEE